MGATSRHRWPDNDNDNVRRAAGPCSPGARRAGGSQGETESPLALAAAFEAVAEDTPRPDPGGEVRGAVGSHAASLESRVVRQEPARAGRRSQVDRTERLKLGSPPTP